MSVRERSKTGLAAFVALALGVLGTPPLVLAQSIYGTIVGTVKDSSGAVVPRVAITVTRVETGEVHHLGSDVAGDYTANNLSPGQYTVEAELAGFKKPRRSGITVQVNTTVKVDLVLPVGDSAELVEVVGEPPLLNTATSSLGHVVDQRSLVTLPLPSAGFGRNFFTFALTAPGVTAQYEGFGLNNLRINGGRPKADDYLLDGTSVQQIVFGGPAITPPLDSIQEFKVDSNSFPAEYGRISGGIMTAITRSGSNAFHGSAWEFLRSDRFDARNFFLPPGQKKDKLRQHEFGGTLGGPLARNKFFFFLDYQGFRRKSDQVFTSIQVPTAAMKAGDFSSFLGGEIGVDACGRPVLAGAIYDPATQRVALPGDPTCPAGSGGRVVRDSFPGNRIFSPRFSRVASGLLPLWPDPVSGTDFSRVAANEDNVNQFDARLDYNASSRDKFFAIFHYADTETTPAQPLPDPRAAGFPQGLRTTDRPLSGTFGWDHTFGSNTINTFRFGFMRRNPSRVPGGYGEVGPADFGLQTFPACNLPGSAGSCGTPIISIPGVHQLSGGSMLFEPAKIFQFSDSLGHSLGSHNLKLGADIRHFRIDNIQPNDVDGSFGFTQAETALPDFAASTGAPFASFLLGLVNNGNAQFQEDFFKTQTSSLAFYVQDDWKVARKLTLNLGLRYQLDLAWKARVTETAGNFNRDTLKYELLGVGGVPETNFDNDYNNFGPRVGFSWNPRTDFVVRGAYGMMFPGNTTRGRGGDLDPSALLLVNTRLNGTQLDALPPINSQVSNPEEFLESVGPFTVSALRTQQQQYFQQWNLTLERQFFRDTLVSVSYAGSKGSRLLNNFFYNIFQLSEEQVRRGESGDGPLGPPGNGDIGWVFPLFSQDANSIYHSLQAKAERRFSKGFSFVASYTLSKLIDDASADWSTFGGLDVQGQDYLNRQNDRAVSAGDIKHRFVLSSIVELPFGPGKGRLNTGLASHILGGWGVSSIFTAHSGFPFGVVDDCFGFCNNARAWATRPDLTGPSALPDGQRTPERWINTESYKSNWFDAQRPFGNAPRYDDAARGPGYANLDLAVIKSTRVRQLGDEGRVELRIELFNTLNSPHLDMPVAAIGAANFGTINRTSSPNRQVQFGLRVVF